MKDKPNLLSKYKLVKLLVNQLKLPNMMNLVMLLSSQLRLRKVIKILN